MTEQVTPPQTENGASLDVPVIEVWRDGWTKGIQVSVADNNSGYRLAGPKFNGSGKRLTRHRLTARDAAEIRRILDRAYPIPPDLNGARNG